MLLDSRNEFADAVALNTGGAGTYLVGDVIDTELLKSDLGPTCDLYLVIQVDTSATSATASPNGAKGQFHVASDAQAAIATDGSATYHYSSGAIEKAGLTAGTTIAIIKLPYGSYERYIGILQTTSVEAFTAGKINAFLTTSPSKWVALPKGN